MSEIVKRLRLRSKLFSLRSQLEADPTSTLSPALKLSICKLEDELNRTKADKKQPKQSENISKISDQFLRKPWNRLNLQLKADRLFVYCMGLDLEKAKKLALFRLMKADLQKRILTKKKEVEYCLDKGVVLSIFHLKSYLEKI
jgi:hypothetical protein